MKLFFDKNKNICAIFIIILLCFLFLKNLLPFNREIIATAKFLPDAAELLMQHYFTVESIKNGIFPLWNPYILCGVPSLAEPQNTVFYPPHLIFLLLPINIAYNYSIVLHLILSGIFMFYFAKTIQIDTFGSLISAITFIFSSIFSLHIFAGHLLNIFTITWLPLLFLLVEKGITKRKIIYPILAGISLSLQIFAGHIQYVCYSIVAIGLFLIFRFVIEPEYRRDILILLLCLFLIGTSLAAVQIIPSLEFTSHSTRATKDLNFIFSLSFPPENLITFFIPEFFGNSLKNTYNYWGRWYFWEMCIYIGIMPIILAMYAVGLRRNNKHVIYFLLLGFVSLVFAIGYNIPILKNILVKIPILNLFRGQAKFIFLLAFSLSILSGIGVNALFELRKSVQPKRILSLCLFVFLLFLAGFIMTSQRFELCFSLWKKTLAFLFSFPGRYWSYNYNHPAFIVKTFALAYYGFKKFLIFLFISLIILSIQRNTKIKSKVVKLLIFLFIIIDLWSFSTKYIVTSKLSDFFWNEETKDVLKKEETLYRIAQKAVWPLNQGIINKTQSIGGCYAIFLKDYSDFISAAQPLYAKDNFVFFFNHSKLLDLINFKYLLVPASEVINDTNFELIYTGEKLNIYRNLKVLPRAFMVFKAKTLTDRKSIINELKSENFSPEKYVILQTDKQIEIPKQTKLQNYDVQIIKYSPNEVQLQVNTPNDGYLFVSDVYYPGWKVFVDDRNDKIYKANLAFRAVYLKKGQHIVRFIYSPFTFKLGTLISILSLILTIVFFTRFLIRTKFSKK
jgi:hypothetical protein